MQSVQPCGKQLAFRLRGAGECPDTCARTGNVRFRGGAGWKARCCSAEAIRKGRAKPAQEYAAGGEGGEAVPYPTDVVAHLRAHSRMPGQHGSPTGKQPTWVPKSKPQSSNRKKNRGDHLKPGSTEKKDENGSRPLGTAPNGAAAALS